MRQPIKAVLFDKDGTLFSFAASWTRAAQAVLATLAGENHALRRALGLTVGFDPDEGVFAPGATVVAGTAVDMAQAWAALLPDMPPAQLVAVIETVAAQHQSPAPATPDLAGLLDGLRARGLPLGVATHDSAAGARADLARAGVLDRFDFIAGYDSGHGLKPGPGMALAFAAAVGLAPQTLAMVGDSPGDLQTGRAVDAAAVIGVLTGPADQTMLAPLADVVLDSIADLPAWLAQRAAIGP